ncbi:MAG: hypothetical protein V1894_03220 [Chloroflexota bacterium]
MGEFALVNRLPTAQELKKLREAVGWHNVDDEGTRISLEKTLFSVVVERKGEAVGMGRVIGDGGMYFYIQDVLPLSYRARAWAGLSWMLLWIT